MGVPTADIGAKTYNLARFLPKSGWKLKNIWTEGESPNTISDVTSPLQGHHIPTTLYFAKPSLAKYLPPQQIKKYLIFKSADKFFLFEFLN